MTDRGDLVSALHARGLRMTPQRREVLAAVRTMGHATPEELADAVPGVDLVTVYRTLDVLEEIGLVRHTHLRHGATTYRPAEDDHVHVVCHTCGRTTDHRADLVDDLAATLYEREGFVIDRAHLTVFGRCADCAAHQTDSDAAEQIRPHVHSHS